MVNQVSQNHIEALIKAITEQRNFALDRQADLTAHIRIQEDKIKELESFIASLEINETREGAKL